MIKHVINDDGGTAVAGDFTMAVSAGSASPASFAGEESPGTAVAIDANDPYAVTESGPAGYTASFSADCTDTDGLDLGQTKTCTVTNDDVAPPDVSQITPTGTTCSQFAAGTAPDLPSNEPQYSLKGNPQVINQVNPGVFFYWVTVQTTSAGQNFLITQTITTANFGTYFGLADGSFAYNTSCLKVDATITQSTNTTTVDLASSVPSGTTIIIGIKYNTGSVKGALAPSPTTTVHYDFETTGVSGSTEGLNLQKK